MGLPGEGAMGREGNGRSFYPLINILIAPNETGAVAGAVRYQGEQDTKIW